MAIVFDGLTRRILLQSGTTVLSVRDLWSRWVDWFGEADNSKYPVALTQTGGQDIDPGAGTKIPIYTFLQNSWRIKPQEASHTLNVNDGVLLVDGGGDPFVDTIGLYTVRINFQQPVQAISYTDSGGTSPTVTAIADAVWEKEIIFPISGTFGEHVSQKLLTTTKKIALD